ncbi:MAG: helix-turn-helix transcriptional regulator [Clostridia bacterium]|nr:helix-turn-helix transcriptional regulator [Clostridia bacterium]
MNSGSSFFVTNASFFEVFSSKHKPTEVMGRDFYSLTYRLRGKASIQCNGVLLNSHEDCVTFMPKRLDYTTEITEDVHMIAVHFDLVGNDLPREPFVLPVTEPPLRSLFLALVSKGHDESADPSRMAILYTALAELQRLTHGAGRDAVPKRIVAAKEILEKEYSSPLFSIDALAEQVGVSTSYLRREFLAAYGSTPIRYLKALRIRNAKRLLVLEGSTVAQTAMLCGYSGTSYFIQDFKQATGESPNRYRQRILLTL